MQPVNPTWRRHDAHRFIRHDAHRFFTPAGLEEQKRAAETERAAQRAAEEIDVAALEALRADHERVRIELAEVKFALALRRICRKYSPDQSRVPAGSADGGQWTSGNGGGAGSGPADEGHESGSDGIVLSDAIPDPVRPGMQMANVIRICLLGTRSIGLDRFGNRMGWWADYDCADGFVFRKFGFGGRIPSFLPDPRR